MSTSSFMALLVRLAAYHFGVEEKDVLNGSRKMPFPQARQATYLVALEMGIRTQEIARFFDINHSTVVHGSQQARAAVSIYPIERMRVNRMLRAARTVTER